MQGNVCRLVDLDSGAIKENYGFTAFGEELKPVQDHPFNPWRFQAKRLDPEFGFIHFGKRDYDPGFGRWIQTDPAGFVDSVNLYQYVLNNPFRYGDPEGQFIIAIPLLALTWKVVAVAAVTALVAYELEHRNQHSNSSFERGFNSAVHQVVQNLGGVSQYALNQKLAKRKNTDVYVPDRPLPRDPRTKEPTPEANVPHTELGTREGTKGKYPQAREFDAQGKPVKDIDFTDHERSQNHPNPHEHKWNPNPTGGTPQRSTDAEPLTEWKYE